MSKKNEVAVLSAEQIAILNESYPVSDEGVKLTLPRLGMLSKDIEEESGTGKNKIKKVIQSAGTFYTERDLGETDEEGKKVWTKEFIDGEEIEVIIVYHRRQLRKFDASLKKFISTPIFDNAEQIVPLYLDKQVIKKGTQKELQALYPALTQKGKPSSDLKEDTILYVIYNGEMYQMNLSTSSGYNFKNYGRKTNVPTVITILGSVEDEFGTNVYRKVTFKEGPMITSDDFTKVFEGQTVIKEKVEADNKFYTGSNLIEAPEEQDKELNDFADKFAKK